ncbi:MAG: hypothetical protein R6X17_07375, partial [Candidatus Competibacteraceae bacterium]
LMRLMHPDRAGAADLWVDSYAARINEAYSVLSRPQTRAAYDGSRARGEPSAARVPGVARSRSTAWREAPRRRRSRLAPRAHLPVLVLGGAALVAVLGVAGVYLLAKPSITATAESGSTVAEIPPPLAASPAEGALAAFQASPDWRALEQIEREAGARASRIHAVREQLETDHQNQLRIEQTELERLREERALLEQQLRATRLEVERRRLEQLRAEQARAKQSAEQTRKEQARISRLVEQTPRQPSRQPSPSKAEQGPLESLERAERQTTARELTTRELDILIDHYAGAYQSGDLDRLMALFDVRARGGSGQDRDRLRRDYADFFGATQSRRLSLNPVRWTPRGSTATGVTHYRLRAVQSDGSTHDYEGSLRFEVSRQEARVLIRGIDFDIRRLE